MHIAIIGAGITGLMSALELLEQGCSITILDQQAAGQAASWAGGGILSPMYPWRYPNAVNTLARHAKPLYQAWNQKLQPTSGIDFQIHNTGMLIFDESDFEIGLRYAEQYQDPQQQAQLLDQRQLGQINPRVDQTKFKQALYFPELANIRNPRLLKSIISYLRQHPRVIWQEHCKISQLDIQQGHVQQISSENGLSFQADQFVIATGAWSAYWSEQLGFDIPVQPVQGQMLLFKTPEHWLPSMCMHKVMYLIPRRDGHVLCGSSMRQVGFDTSPSTEIRQDIFAACLEMVPELADFPVVKQWAGLRPSSPDGIPYIGKMPHLDNLWINFGQFRNGLCMGAASGKLLAQLMLEQPTFVDPEPYNPAQRLETQALAV
ncbi:FAD-dependent oxidoreductase [Acinetobacter sp. RF15A]|uniref:NAD(P)/FAD-dependent oxidoreductase n=1 Tax=unclassified Acinetobacter TaxID=196816 RepID=UPI001195E37E|nr:MULTISPECIES: FAD-dependent oxidoreductase [unclassified Acinetobacter]TSH78124.1 FAD-dependent oxidoreductase [Acinetobacter sp. RF15A]TSI20113.1 FAD-dependent oxidoreductase [Acinetobacter sp. RF15B]